jgi:hypothetical protein
MEIKSQFISNNIDGQNEYFSNECLKDVVEKFNKSDKDLPVSLEFRRQENTHFIGKVKDLEFVENKGVNCTVEITNEKLLKEEEELYFAPGGIYQDVEEKDGIRKINKIKLTEISLVKDHADKTIPPINIL